jgi:hypothetical protein
MMRTKFSRYFFVCLATIVFVLGTAGQTWAGEKGKWRARDALVAVKSKTVPIADQKDHYVYFGEWDGVIFTEGEGTFLQNARYQLVDIVDSAGAVVPGGEVGYKTFTAAAGGQVFAKYHATEPAAPVFKGKWEFIGGTGKYAGIKGDGTFTYHSITEDTGWDVLEGEDEIP